MTAVRARSAYRTQIWPMPLASDPPGSSERPCGDSSMPAFWSSRKRVSDGVGQPIPSARTQSVGNRSQVAAGGAREVSSKSALGRRYRLVVRSLEHRADPVKVKNKNYNTSEGYSGCNFQRR